VEAGVGRHGVQNILNGKNGGWKKRHAACVTAWASVGEQRGSWVAGNRPYATQFENRVAHTFCLDLWSGKWEEGERRGEEGLHSRAWRKNL
jgi:hypothetical protein